MDEQDGLALAFIQISEFQSVIVEKLHGWIRQCAIASIAGCRTLSPIVKPRRFAVPALTSTTRRTGLARRNDVSGRMAPHFRG